MKMAPFDRVADQSSTFRADLKAQGKRRRERLSSLTSAPPLRRRNDLLPPLRVEELSLADRVGPARNVRRQEAAQIREVAASIAELGFCDPVLIGGGNTVLNGMIRVEAAKQLGLPRIPCIRVEHLTGSEQRLLRVALNRLGENGAWSLEDLKVEFEELIVEQTPIEISGSRPKSIKSCLATIRRLTNRGRLRPRQELSRSPGKATSFFLASIRSPAATPPLRTSSRLSCGTMARPGWS